MEALAGPPPSIHLGRELVVVIGTGRSLSRTLIFQRLAVRRGILATRRVRGRFLDASFRWREYTLAVRVLIKRMHRVKRFVLWDFYGPVQIPFVEVNAAQVWKYGLPFGRFAFCDYFVDYPTPRYVSLFTYFEDSSSLEESGCELVSFPGGSGASAATKAEQLGYYDKSTEGIMEEARRQATLAAQILSGLVGAWGTVPSLHGRESRFSR